MCKLRIQEIFCLFGSLSVYLPVCCCCCCCFVCLFVLFVCLSLCCASGSSSVYSFVFFSLQSPEFFYSCVKSDLGLTSVFDVLKFTDALEKLVG